MKAEEVIEALNRHAEIERDSNIKGHFILQRSTSVNSSFKAYKTYVFTVWYVHNEGSFRTLTISNSARVITGQEDEINRTMEIELCMQVYKFITSDFYQHIIKGDYSGNINEQISN